MRVKLMGKRVLSAVKHKLCNVIFVFFSLLPYRDMILFESEGDFSDNTYAFYDYLVKQGRISHYKAVWLVDYPRKWKGRQDCEVIKKYPKGISLKRLLYLATCRYYIYDHCNVLGQFPVRKEQVICNLWHGCAFKRTKVVDITSKNTMTFLIITGEFWRKIMAEFVQCSPEKAHVLGHPRNDYLFEKNGHAIELLKNKGWNQKDKVFFWMPTFRTSSTQELSENYYKGITGLPIIYTQDDILELDTFLRLKGAFLVFKVHHLQLDYPILKEKFSNIIILKDDEIQEYGLQLYQMIALADALVTDYSSVSVDYMLTDRPIIYTLEDYEDYKGSRGFSFQNPIDYFPGHHVYEKMQLFNAMDDIIKGNDPYSSDRKKILPIMHRYLDGKSCERIARFLSL